MAIRFNRRFGIVPGVRLNLGKRGASIGLGKRGAWLTIGRKGIHTSIGLPGTGLYWTEQTPWQKTSTPTNQPSIPSIIAPLSWAILGIAGLAYLLLS
jgi:hypothetical protein